MGHSRVRPLPGLSTAGGKGGGIGIPDVDYPKVLADLAPRRSPSVWSPMRHMLQRTLTFCFAGQPYLLTIWLFEILEMISK